MPNISVGLIFQKFISIISSVHLLHKLVNSRLVFCLFDTNIETPSPILNVRVWQFLVKHINKMNELERGRAGPDAAVDLLCLPSTSLVQSRKCLACLQLWLARGPPAATDSVCVPSHMAGPSRVELDKQTVAGPSWTARRAGGSIRSSAFHLPPSPAFQSHTFLFIIWFFNI